MKDAVKDLEKNPTDRVHPKTFNLKFKTSKG